RDGDVHDGSRRRRVPRIRHRRCRARAWRRWRCGDLDLRGPLRARVRAYSVPPGGSAWARLPREVENSKGEGMTTIFDNPEEFAEDQLAGWLDLYSDRVRGVTGGVVALPVAGAAPQVAVVIGGGSGHYPAFCGTVGTGFATGAVVGNIFTSPSAAQVYSVAKAADQGRGVVLSFGNYAGDNMNFGLAAERLRQEGIDTRIVVVTDDIASADEESSRRGIAGDFPVFKAMGAAAAEGRSLDDVEAAGRAANAATRTIGVAFSGCTMPGATEPLFTVPEGHLGLGLGIHEIGRAHV